MSDAPGHVAIIGAGPAGLMAAETAAAAGARVTVYDRMASPGRKFLLAGRGGLNLTHSEPMAAFLSRYGAAAASLEPAIAAFAPDALRGWCKDLGIDTFVGTSGRVFPASFKTSPLLRAWLRRLDAASVAFRVRHRWAGFDEGGDLRFETGAGSETVAADATVLALGGASWPHLGSDGAWVEALSTSSIRVAPLQPANCGFHVSWSDRFAAQFEGAPLKNVAVSFEGESARGDLVVTRTGVEGGPCYALAARLRTALADPVRRVTLVVALRPDMPRDALVARLGRRRARETLTNALRKALGLAPVAIGLLREGARQSGRDLAQLDAGALADLVNAVPIAVTAPMALTRAISTAGGVAFDETDERLMLKRRLGIFVAGEMLDWEAPTGGYLLQGAFATGRLAGQGAARWANRAKVEEDDGARPVL